MPVPLRTSSQRLPPAIKAPHVVQQRLRGRGAGARARPHDPGHRPDMAAATLGAGASPCDMAYPKDASSCSHSFCLSMQ